MKVSAKRNSSHPRARHASGLFDGLVIDNFAGGGGASLGMERAFGRAVDVAINHDRQAVMLHQANHPATLHYCEDVWSVDPTEVTRGRPGFLVVVHSEDFPQVVAEWIAGLPEDDKDRLEGMIRRAYLARHDLDAEAS